MKELEKLYQNVLGISEKDARLKAEAAKQSNTINKEIKILNSQMHEVVFQSDYLYRTFQEQTAELKNQNTLLKVSKSVFKGLTDIAQDLNYFQRGTTDLTDKQFKKMQSGLGIQKKELEFVIERLSNSEGEYKNQVRLDKLQSISTDKLSIVQKRRLEELQKEKDLLTASQAASADGIPMLQREYDISRQIYKVREDLGGLAKGVAGVVAKYGGSLAQFLDVSDAIDSVNEYNKSLIDGALRDKKVQGQLVDIENKKLSIQEQLETGRFRDEKTGKFVKATEEERLKRQNQLNSLEQEGFNVKQNAIASVNTLGNKFKSLGVLAKGLGAGLAKALTDPLTIMTFIYERANQFNKASVDISKNFGIGAGGADRMAQSVADIANNSTNLNVTFKSAIEAMTQLNEATGFVQQYSADALETQVMLTKQFGLTGEEAANIYKYSVLTGKSSEKVNDEMVGAFVAARNQLGVGIPFKQTMADAAKVSGQLAANLQNNPVGIVKAVATVKALGTTLEQTKAQGESLLNFESSIENELKAELLTGQQMNLERARAAALAGDQVTVAQELANQGMDLAKFQGMNVLQQKAFADAIGLSSDQLAEQLKKQQLAIKNGESYAELTAREAIEAEKRQAVQDKFNLAIEKLQDFFGNLVGGPVSQLLDSLTKILGLVTDVLQPVLNVVFKPIAWAVSLLGKMEGVLKGILAVYIGIKAAQLTSNVLEAVKTAQLVAQGDAMAVQSVLQEKNIAKLIIYKTISLAQAAIEGTKAFLINVQKEGLIAQLAKLPALIGLKSAEAAVATEAAAAEVVGAEAVSFGAATAWIVGGLAAVLAAMAMFKGPKFAEGGIVTGEINNATIGEAGPEAIIPLNSPKADKLLGNNASVDLTPMIAAINEVRSAVNSLVNRPIYLSIDGKNIGTALVQGSYKLA